MWKRWWTSFTSVCSQVGYAERTETVMTVTVVDKGIFKEAVTEVQQRVGMMLLPR